MNKKIIQLILTLFSLSAFGSSPEQNLLKRLDLLKEKFGNNPAFPSLIKRTSRAAEEQKKMKKYIKKLNPDYRKQIDQFQTLLKSPPQETAKTIEHHLENTPVLKPAQLHSYFKSLIQKKKFTIHPGDIVLTLPATKTAILYAYLMDSPYEHLDLIIIQNQEPYVLEITQQHDLNLIPLADHLLGTLYPNQAFAIYRHTPLISLEQMNTHLKNITQKKILYDPYFIRQTHQETEDTHFFYCGELVYFAYETFLKNAQFESPWTINIKTALNKQKKDIKLHSPIIQILTKNQKTKFIGPNTFSQSPHFYETAKAGIPFDSSQIKS